MPLMFLNGGAMRGGPLHHLLRGAPLIGTVRTAPKYRFFSVGDRFPMLAVHDRKITGPPNEDEDEFGSASVREGVSEDVNEGVPVVGELYDVPWDVLRESLLPAEPAELELGVIELEDGSGALAMIRRRVYAEADVTLRDISEHADWRAYMASRPAKPSASTAPGASHVVPSKGE